jgi:type II secretory pathway predicted ATPase ExeA
MPTAEKAVSIYTTHWGLRDTPFRDCHDPRSFYQSPTHDEALARLYFLVDERRRLGILMGPTGVGKSLLLEVFAAQLRRKWIPVALLSLVGIEPQECLQKIALGLGLNCGRSDTTVSLWRRVLDRLLEFRYQHQAVVILLDDVDQAAPAVLAQVTRLVQYDRSPESRLTLVLAGRNDRMSRIGPALAELAELRIDLEPWDESDTQDYLQRSLTQAGCRREVFAPGAIARLHELACGIPRRVTQLADLSLLAAAGRELPQVDAEVVESAYHELGVVLA